MDRLARERLKWKCRRGLLELDIVLRRFLEQPPLHAADAVLLHELLDLPDHELWDIVAGRSDRYQPHLQELVARLRAS